MLFILPQGDEFYQTRCHYNWLLSPLSRIFCGHAVRRRRSDGGENTAKRAFIGSDMETETEAGVPHRSGVRTMRDAFAAAKSAASLVSNKTMQRND